ncbi:hypothetical protein RDI58_026881 [Solanum bulbocastanum]|uniref:C-JID domain-containing protein n=1 Tax=Solanum bulbocastanum TaxID=147425 RepID=A0AAN8SUF8_SOLBU
MLDLSYSHNHMRTPYFTRMPNLEDLDLMECTSFEEVHHSLEVLDLNYSQLGSLRTLDLSHCKRLTQLPKFPQLLVTIDADWSNDSFYNSLFQNNSSLQHNICASDSLSLRVFMSWAKNIPSWFHLHAMGVSVSVALPKNWYVSDNFLNISSLQHEISALDSLSLRVFTSRVKMGNIPSWFSHQGMGTRVSVNLPENWYVSDMFLGFAVCYSRKFIAITTHLIPLCDDGMSLMTQKLAYPTI